MEGCCLSCGEPTPLSLDDSGDFLCGVCKKAIMEVEYEYNWDENGFDSTGEELIYG